MLEFKFSTRKLPPAGRRKTPGMLTRRTQDTAAGRPGRRPSAERATVKYKALYNLVVALDFTTLLIPQVISVAFYSEREKSDKFCSETLISA